MLYFTDLPIITTHHTLKTCLQCINHIYPEIIMWFLRSYIYSFSIQFDIPSIAEGWQWDDNQSDRAHGPRRFAYFRNPWSLLFISCIVLLMYIFREVWHRYCCKGNRDSNDFIARSWFHACSEFLCSIPPMNTIDLQLKSSEIASCKQAALKNS